MSGEPHVFAPSPLERRKRLQEMVAAGVFGTMALASSLRSSSRDSRAMNLAMITQTPKGGYYLGKEGGGLNAIVGSLVSWTAGPPSWLSLFSLPTVLYINLYKRRNRLLPVRFSLDVLGGHPLHRLRGLRLHPDDGRPADVAPGGHHRRGPGVSDHGLGDGRGRPASSSSLHASAPGASLKRPSTLSSVSAFQIPPPPSPRF